MSRSFRLLSTPTFTGTAVVSILGCDENAALDEPLTDVSVSIATTAPLLLR